MLLLHLKRMWDRWIPSRHNIETTSSSVSNIDKYDMITTRDQRGTTQMLQHGTPRTTGQEGNIITHTFQDWPDLPICAPPGFTTHSSWNAISTGIQFQQDSKSLRQKSNGAVENNPRSTSCLVWDLPRKWPVPTALCIGLNPISQVINKTGYRYCLKNW